MNTKSSVAVACFLPGRAKDLSAPLYVYKCSFKQRYVTLILTHYFYTIIFKSDMNYV